MVSSSADVDDETASSSCCVFVGVSVEKRRGDRGTWDRRATVPSEMAEMRVGGAEKENALQEARCAVAIIVRYMAILSFILGLGDHCVERADCCVCWLICWGFQMRGERGDLTTISSRYVRHDD